MSVLIPVAIIIIVAALIWAAHKRKDDKPRGARNSGCSDRSAAGWRFRAE